MPERNTLYDKIVDEHVVEDLSGDGQHVLLYIDRTVLNEYTSPQAFTGLRQAGRNVWRPDAALGVIDHVNTTQKDRPGDFPDVGGAEQARYFDENCRDFGIELFDVFHPMQGIEHVVMAETGRVLPGMVVAAGDSHTTTYGALGALGFGIGTSDIEHYLATQTLPYHRLKTMRVSVDGMLGPGVYAKDIIMALIEKIGAAGAVGYAIEFTGPAIAALSVESRMTICNMAVECGARGALIMVDEKTLHYLEGLPHAPTGEAWQQARTYALTLKSDPQAKFHRSINLRANDIAPMVSWGTSPDQTVPVTGSLPDPDNETDPVRKQDMIRAMRYMGVSAGQKIAGIPITHAFIGSCTNARIEDLREAATILTGRKIARQVRGLIVPGSRSVARHAEREGLDRVFVDAGFEWRSPGCSMCLAMNDDVLAPGDRCASSTNRNFEGRQGAGARTHLMSPAMVAASAIAGRITDSRIPSRGA